MAQNENTTMPKEGTLSAEMEQVKKICGQLMEDNLPNLKENEGGYDQGYAEGYQDAIRDVMNRLNLPIDQKFGEDYFN